MVVVVLCYMELQGMYKCFKKVMDMKQYQLFNDSKPIRYSNIAHTLLESLRHYTPA
jgi:hypothetical protein